MNNQKFKTNNKFILPHKLLLIANIEEDDKQLQEEDEDDDNHFYCNDTLQSIKESIIALFDWLTNEKKIKQQLIRSNLHLTQTMLIASKENVLRIQYRFHEIHIMLQIETLKRQLRQQFLQKLTPSFNHSLILTEHFSAIHPIVQQYKQKTKKTKEKIRRNQRGITPNAYSSSNKPKPPKYERLQGSVWNGTEYKYQLLTSLSHKLLMKLIFSAFSYLVSSNKIQQNAINTLQHLSQKKLLQLTFASLLYECISNQYIVLNSWLKVRSFIQTKYIFSTIKHWQWFIQRTIHYSNQQRIAYKHARQYLFSRKGWIPFKQRMIQSHSRKIFQLISKKIKHLMIYKKILLIWTLAMIQKQSLRQQLVSSSTSSASQFKQTYYLSSQLHINHSESLQTNQQFTKYHIQQILHVQFLTILHQIQALFDGKYVLWSPCSTSFITSRKYRFINKHVFLGSLNKVCQLPILSQPSTSSPLLSIPSTEDHPNKQSSKQSLLQQTIRNQKRISLYQTQTEQPTQRFQQRSQQQAQLLQQIQSELQDIITNNTSTRYPIHSSSSSASFPPTSHYITSSSFSQVNHQTNDPIDDKSPSINEETSLNISKSIIPKISYSNFPTKSSQSQQSLIERALEIHQDSLIASSSVSKKTFKSFGMYSPNDDSDNESIIDSNHNDNNNNTREQQRQLREQQSQQLFQHFQIKRIDHMFALMRYFIRKLFKQTKYHQRFLHIKRIHRYRNKHQRFVQWKKLYEKILFQYQLVDTIASFKLLKQQFGYWKTNSYEYRSQQRQQLLQITNYYLLKSIWKKIKEVYLSMHTFHFYMKQFQKRMKLYHWKQWKIFILQEKHYRLSIQRIELLRIRKFWRFWFSKCQRKQLLKRVFSLSSHMQSMHKEYEQSIQLSNYQWLHTIFMAWKQYFVQKKEQCIAYKSLQIALEFRGLTLLSNMFDQWLIYTIQQRGVRQYLASQQRKLLTKVFSHWSKYIFHLQPNEEYKLINNYQLQYIIHKYFQVWLRLYQYSNLIDPISRNNCQNIPNNVSSPLPSAIKRLRPNSLTSSSPTSPYTSSNNSRLKISIPAKEAPIAPAIVSQLQEQQELLQYHIYHLQHKHLLLTKQQYFQVWKHEFALKQAYHQIHQHYQRKYLLKRPFWWWRVWKYQRSRYQQGFNKLNQVYNLFKLRRCFMNWPLRHGLMKMKELQLKIAERSVGGTRSRIELVDIEENPNILKRTLHPEETNKRLEPPSSTSSAIISSYNRNDGLQSLLQYRTKSFVRTAPKPLFQRALYYGYLTSRTDKVTYEKLVRLLTTILQYWSQYVDMSRRLRVLYIQLRGLRRLRILERLLFHWIALTPRISYRVITWLNSMKRRAHDEYMFNQYGTRGIDNFQPAKITKQAIEIKER